MKYKKSEGGILGWQTIIVIAIIIVIGLILLAATGALGDIGKNIWKGIKDTLPFF
jgi:hypothetical protein